MPMLVNQDSGKYAHKIYKPIPKYRVSKEVFNVMV